LRILYVCSDFGVPVYGHKGASIHLRSMARAFQDAGHGLRIVSPSTERDANLDFEAVAGTPVAPDADSETLALLRRVDRWLGKQDTGHASRLGHEIRNLLYNQRLAAAAPALAAWSPEVVYERYSLFGFGGLELARALGVPHVLEVNAPLCVEQQRVRGLHLVTEAQSIETRVWCGTDGLLAVSEELRAEALQRGADAARVHVLPNGVDAARFVARPEAAPRLRAELALGDGPVIGFVGSLKSWHGTEVLIDAFAGLAATRPAARLLVVGDGPMAEALRAQAERLGVAAAVRFTGAVEHAQVADTIAAMDVTAAPYLPSEDFYFSPIKIYEYLAAGKPVVASRLGQIGALADAGLVDAVAPGDVQALQRGLEAVLAAPEAAATRAARGRDWVFRERTWAANARRALEIAAARSAARVR
jgi:glycosyltransferase involved in cell wall biosynthesis